MKRLLRSKTFWTGIGGIVAGVAICLSGDVATGAPMAFIGIQTIFIRDALNSTAKATQGALVR